MKSVESQAETASVKRGSVLENRGCGGVESRHAGAGIGVGRSEIPSYSRVSTCGLITARQLTGTRPSARAAASILASLLLAACATHPAKLEPTVQIRTVSVPVAVKCAVDPGPEPNYADTPEAIAAAPNIFELAKLYAEGRAQRIGRLIELQAANAGCR